MEQPQTVSREPQDLNDPKAEIIDMVPNAKVDSLTGAYQVDPQIPIALDLGQSKRAPLADSSSESAKYNRGPQQIASADEHVEQMNPVYYFQFR
jgi:hypothetical protein